MSDQTDHTRGPLVGPPEPPPEQTDAPSGTPDVVDTSGPGDVPAGIVINGTDVTEPIPEMPPADVPSGKTRLKVAYPGTYFAAGGDLPVVSSAGTDVDPSQAEAILAAAKTAPGVTVEEAV